MAEHPVLRVNLPTIDHDGLHLASHGLALGSKVMTHVVRNGRFPGSRHPVEGHVTGNVAFQGFPQVVGNFLNLVLSMRKLRGTVVVPKVFLVFEEGFLGNKLVEDVGFH